MIAACIDRTPDTDALVSEYLVTIEEHTLNVHLMLFPFMHFQSMQSLLTQAAHLIDFTAYV